MSHEEVAEFVRLLGEHERSLYAFILSMVANWNQADEIAQRVRIRLWEQFSEYDRDKDFGAWSRTIAYYLVLAERKTASRQMPVLSPEFLDAVSQQFDQTVGEVPQRQAALAHCLGELSPEHRRLIQRYYGGSEDRRQIAVEIGRSYDALRQSVQRIRQALSRCIRNTLSREETA